jgi:micrococcal nuclease
MATKKRKNRNKKYILSVIATVAVLALIYLITYLFKQSINSVSQDLDGPYDVVSVIDGDTIIVKSDGGDVHVRLIGIDTPESVASDGYKVNTPEGDKASEYTRNLLEGNSVYLEYDKEQTDSYQRTLAYV